MLLRAVTELPCLPKRIVSLVPSQTLLLHYLGLEAETVGITKFCIHPESWFRSKTRIGGTKNIHPEIIDRLQPDLIIANHEENVKEQVEALAERYPVWVSDVRNLASALDMIRDIGRLTGTSTGAGELVNGISRGFEGLEAMRATLPSPLRTTYLIWKDPYMTVGGDTFIHDMLQQCGLHNIFGGNMRYPEITIHQLKEAGCELLLLSSEPYPFKEKHIVELQSQLPATKIVLINGEMFSWYGSTLLEAPGYFGELMKGLGGLGDANTTLNRGKY